MDYSDKERDLAIRIMLGEASDQGPNGLAGVANVMRNRVESGRFGDNLNTVLKTPYAFEPYMTRRREIMSYAPQSQGYQTAGAIFDAVMKDDIDDNTGGATHFYSPTSQAAFGRQRPQWSRSTPTAAIGGHVFYAPEGKVDRTAATEDLLGGYAKDLDQPQAAAPAQSEDLLGGYAKALPAETPKTEQKPVEVTVKPMGQPEGESSRGLINRVIKEHPGTGVGDVATRFGMGALRGVADVADTLGQGITYAGEKGAQALQKLGAISSDTAQAVANWRARTNERIAGPQAEFENVAGNSAAANIGRIAGQVAGTAPALGAAGGAIGGALEGSALSNAMAARPALNTLIGGAAKGAGIGAGTSLLTSAASNQPLGEQLASGATTGAIVGPVGAALGGVARRVGSETSDLARAAMEKYGIPITAGQISSNPMVNFAENVLRKLPLTGYAANTEAQNAAFTRAISNQMGIDTDRVTRGAVKEAKRTVGPVFDQVAKNTGSMPLTPKFVNDVGSILSDARSVLGDGAKPVENQVERIVSMLKDGAISGDNYLALTNSKSTLSQLQKNGGVARSYAGRIRNALDDLLQTHAAPEDVGALRQARQQWAAIKAIEPLANKSAEGRISPALLLSRVKGENDLEELGRVGQRFLKPPPSSGTAERSAVMGGLLHGLEFGAGFGLGEFMDPENLQRNALMGIAAAGGGATLGRLAAGGLRSRYLARQAAGLGPRVRIPVFPTVGVSAGNVLAPAPAAANSNP